LVQGRRLYFSAVRHCQYGVNIGWQTAAAEKHGQKFHCYRFHYTQLHRVVNLPLDENNRIADARLL